MGKLRDRFIRSTLEGLLKSIEPHGVDESVVLKPYQIEYLARKSLEDSEINRVIEQRRNDS